MRKWIWVLALFTLGCNDSNTFITTTSDTDFTGQWAVTRRVDTNTCGLEIPTETIVTINQTGIGFTGQELNLCSMPVAT